MAQQKGGHPGESDGQIVVKGLHVSDQEVPPSDVAEKAIFALIPGGAPVAQVVVAGHGEAPVGQKPGEGIIPAYVFRDAVDQLDRGPWSPPFRAPPDAVYLVNAVAGGKEKIPPGWP